MQIPAPANPRDLLLLFALYEPAKGLPSILDQVNFTGVTPQQVHYSAFGRMPDAAQAAVGADGYAAREHLSRTLHSPEFQQRIIRTVLEAFPEKRRLLFVHIPKCAGTDLSFYLQERYPALHQTLSVEAWANHAAFFRSLRDLVLHVGFSEQILVHGHMRLRWYLGNHIPRFGDRLFTVIRDPARIVISQVNYVITRMLADREATMPDTRDWLAQLGMDRLGETAPRELAALARRILREPALVPRNYLCQHLGQGDAASALAAVASCDIEITDVGRYQAWLRESWGIKSSSRHNASRQVITKEQLAPDDLSHVQELVSEDQKLYDRIIGRLKASPGLSVRGYQLA